MRWRGQAACARTAVRCAPSLSKACRLRVSTVHRGSAVAVFSQTPASPVDFYVEGPVRFTGVVTDFTQAMYGSSAASFTKRDTPISYE